MRGGDGSQLGRQALGLLDRLAGNLGLAVASRPAPETLHVTFHETGRATFHPRKGWRSAPARLFRKGPHRRARLA